MAMRSGYYVFMSRPLRIEFEGAWYHVMNRGARGRTIFKDDFHREYFLSLLKEVSDRFDADIHAYCLMDNHYHLMIRTPGGNLQYIMKYINGVYTQYYNRTMQVDGPLFRGRYKAILIDAESYWLELSRYIHCNPLKARIVQKLEDYPWSSYSAYIGQVDKPTWLTTNFILEAISKVDPIEAYKAFVAEGASQEIECFYSKKKVDSVLGDKVYRYAVLNDIERNIETPELKQVKPRPSMHKIVSTIAKYFHINPEAILLPIKGRSAYRKPRALAMFVCQDIGGYPLREIAEHFGLSNYRSVDAATRKIRRMVRCRLIKDLDIVKRDLTPLG